MTRWYHVRADGTFPALPPRRGAGMWSVMAWVALSDGRVVRAQCLYAMEGGLHSWYLDADDDGTPGGVLAPDVRVVAWSLIQPPAHPLRAHA